MINIVLFQPEIPQNTGNIFRTAMAIGARLHLIKPLGFSLDEKSLKRSGMDYIKDVDYQLYENIDDFYGKNPTADIYYITRYAKRTYTSCDFSKVAHDYYFMFGRESTGIPHDVLREHEDRILRIPMIPSSRSLNLSNCVAIICYEALRQQNYFGLATTEVIKGPDFLKEEKK